MALPSSGAITLAQIQAEFGGVNPISLSEYYKGGAYVLSGDAAPNVPTSGTISIGNFYGAGKNVVGQIEYTTAGTYSFVVPAGVTSVCAVTIGCGGNGSYTSPDGLGDTGGGGGGLSYSNGVAVTPFETLTVVVATGGSYVATSIKRGATVLVQAANAGGSGGGNAALGVGSVRYSGGDSSGLAGYYSSGGGSGRWTANGSDGGASPYPGGQGDCPTLYGANTGTAIGAGASGGVPIGSPAPPQTGAARIMWGIGRAFPSTNSGNL